MDQHANFKKTPFAHKMKVIIKPPVGFPAWGFYNQLNVESEIQKVSKYLFLYIFT